MPTQNAAVMATQATGSALKLTSGDIIQVQPWSEQPGQMGHLTPRSYVRVIGFLPGLSLMVLAPQSGGRAVFVREGQVLNVRVMAGERLYGFRTTVLKVCLRPFPYLHLAPPEDMQTMALRKSQRVELAIPTSVLTSRGPVSALIRDLSAGGGALIETQRPLGELGETVTISMRLTVAGLLRDVRLEAVIRNHRQTGSPGAEALAYGLEFAEMDDAARLVLHATIYERLLDEISGSRFAPKGR